MKVYLYKLMRHGTLIKMYFYRMDMRVFDRPTLNASGE